MSSRIIIAIDGMGTAGKSTLAQALQSRIPQCAVVSTDDFCHPPTGKAGEWWGDTVQDVFIDWQRLRSQLVAPFKAGAENICFESLDWNARALHQKTLPPCSTLIVEGCHSLHRELRPYIDLGIWLDSEDKSLFERVSRRDGADMIPHWEKEVRPIFRRYIEEHRPHEAAHIVFNALEASNDDIGRLALRLKGTA